VPSHVAPSSSAAARTTARGLGTNRVRSGRTVAPSRSAVDRPLLRRTRHQECRRAAGTHYGPTQIYRPTGHAIGGTACTACTSELVYRCYRLRAAPLSVKTTDRAEQPGDGPCRRRRGPRDSHESAVGQLEQLADEGRIDPAQSGLNDHATTGSGATCQSDARDSEPLLAPVAGHVPGILLLCSD
jgi:hypothetical protein